MFLLNAVKGYWDYETLENLQYKMFLLNFSTSVYKAGCFFIYNTKCSY